MVVYGSAHGRLFAVCSILRATKLWLDKWLYNWNTKTKIYGSELTGDTRSRLTLCDNGSLLVMVRYCANMLAIFLPKGSSSITDTRSHVKCHIVLSDIKPF